MKSRLVQFKVTLDNIVHSDTKGEGNRFMCRVRMVFIFDCCVHVSLKALKNQEIPCKASDTETEDLKGHFKQKHSSIRPGTFPAVPKFR